MPNNFKGFTPQSIEFLRALAVNNNKTWFEKHRPEYYDHILKPFQQLVMDLSTLMLSIDPLFDTTPAVNRTIARIYRDTRFARDKSPYRSNLWIVFKYPHTDWKSEPGYFFELFPDFYRYGMGFYQAPYHLMERLRDFLCEHPDEFLKLISPISRRGIFTVAGDKYKRPIKAQMPSNLLDWLSCKSFYLVKNCRINRRLFSALLVKELCEAFQTTVPYYRFLRSLTE